MSDEVALDRGSAQRIASAVREVEGTWNRLSTVPGPGTENQSPLSHVCAIRITGTWDATFKVHPGVIVYHDYTEAVYANRWKILGGGTGSTCWVYTNSVTADLSVVGDIVMGLLIGVYADNKPLFLKETSVGPVTAPLKTQNSDLTQVNAATTDLRFNQATGVRVDQLAGVSTVTAIATSSGQQGVVSLTGTPSSAIGQQMGTGLKTFQGSLVSTGSGVPTGVAFAVGLKNEAGGGLIGGLYESNSGTTGLGGNPTSPRPVYGSTYTKSLLGIFSAPDVSSSSSLALIQGLHSTDYVLPVGWPTLPTYGPFGTGIGAVGINCISAGDPNLSTSVPTSFAVVRPGDAPYSTGDVSPLKVGMESLDRYTGYVGYSANFRWHDVVRGGVVVKRDHLDYSDFDTLQWAYNTTSIYSPGHTVFSTGSAQYEYLFRKGISADITFVSGGVATVLNFRKGELYGLTRDGVDLRGSYIGSVTIGGSVSGGVW